jgi:ankyrin repeat protein
MLIIHSYICDRFRWVYCQLEILRHCLPGSVRRVLAQLPETLDETYERILREIPKANREHAHQLLQCLTVAVRPLTVEELAEVLAVDFSADGVPKLKEDLRWEDQEQAVLSACSSLVTVIVDDWDSRIVQFSHFSVKEFLTSGRLAASNMDTLCRHHIRLEPAHIVMAKACLGTLFRFDCEFEANDRTIKKFPLSLYAANHIGDHAEFEDVISHIQDGIDCLLDAKKPHFATWIRICRGHYKTNNYPPSSPAPYETPMYYIADFGFFRMAQYLISRRPQDVNALRGEYKTPLSAALERRHTEISRLLLAHYPDVDIWNSDHETPLHLAAYHGTVEIIPMLIERGADVNARATYGKTPLHYILRHEPTDMMQFLLENNADVNAKCRDYHRTPLHVASEFGYLEPARLLLEHGANVHAQDDRGKTPLRISSENGHLQVMHLLLQHGADPDTQDKDYLRTPLYDGKPDVVRLLLEHGANPHVWDDDGTTPLHYLSERSLSKWEDDVDKMRALLEYGKNPDVLDKRNNTPLHIASEIGKFKVVQLLIEHGANVNMRNKSGHTPLHESASGDHLDVMQSLLEHGADINAQSICHDTALHSALWYGCKLEAVQLLYEHGANVHARNNRGETPLHGIFTRPRPDPRLIESFLEYGADMDIKADDHSTLLHLASKEAYPELAQLLLEHGANVDAQNDAGQTPLHKAIKSLVINPTEDGLSVLHILLAHGANVNAQDIDHSTPLHLFAPCRNGYLVTTQLLLDHGADANMRNNEGKTASDIAGVHMPFSIVWRVLSKHMSERETIPTVITEG